MQEHLSEYIIWVWRSKFIPKIEFISVFKRIAIEMLNAKIVTNKIEWQTKTRGNLQHRELYLTCFKYKQLSQIYKEKKKGNICKECYQAIHIRKNMNSQQIYENMFDQLRNVMGLLITLAKLFFFCDNISIVNKGADQEEEVIKQPKVIVWGFRDCKEPNSRVCSNREQGVGL